MNVRAASGRCHLAESLLIQLCYNYVSVPVLHQAIGRRNGLALGGANANCIDLYSKIGRFLCRGNGVILVVLTVRNDHNHAAFFALRAETLDTQVYSISNGRSLDGNGPRIYGPEEHLGADIVRGDGQLYKRRSGKDYKADAVLLEFVRKARYGKFCPFQPIGGIILRKHGIGNVQGNQYLSALSLFLGQPGTRLWPCKADNEEHEAKAEEGYPYPAFSA